MTSTKILLIRHGQTETTGKILPGRTPGLHLNTLGIQQAKALAALLEPSIKLSCIKSSPLERAQETALPLLETYHLPLTIDERINECDFGSWTGKPLRELSQSKDWEIVQKNPSTFTFPNGESFLHMQSRIVQCIKEYRDEFFGETVALISHADPIKSALAYFTNSHLDSLQKFSLAPCSLSIIEFHTSQTVLLCTNYTTNLSRTLALS